MTPLRKDCRCACHYSKGMRHMKACCHEEGPADRLEHLLQKAGVSSIVVPMQIKGTNTIVVYCKNTAAVPMVWEQLPVVAHRSTTT